jgi:hypothetical protein
MTANQIFDGFSEQIIRCHLEAAIEGVNQPILRSVMTRRTRDQFLRHETFQRTYSAQCFPPFEQCDFEFRGSYVTLVPGEDYFFHTRCVNLLEP